MITYDLLSLKVMIDPLKNSETGMLDLTVNG